MEFDKYAKSYSDDLKKSMPTGFKTVEYFSEYKVKLAKRLSNGVPGRVLDFGCGIGQCSVRLIDEFPNSTVLGFDVSEDSLNVARVKMPEATFTSNWDQVAKQTFDLIFASNVFHHIQSDDHLLWLSRLKSALTPNGTLVIFEHNPLNPLTRIVFKRCIFDIGATMIGQKNFLQLARTAGFSGCSSRYTLFFPEPLKFLEPVETYLGWLPLGAQYYLALKR